MKTTDKKKQYQIKYNMKSKEKKQNNRKIKTAKETNEKRS